MAHKHEISDTLAAIGIVSTDRAEFIVHSVLNGLHHEYGLLPQAA